MHDRAATMLGIMIGCGCEIDEAEFGGLYNMGHGFFCCHCCELSVPSGFLGSSVSGIFVRDSRQRAGRLKFTGETKKRGGLRFGQLVGEVRCRRGKGSLGYLDDI